MKILLINPFFGRDLSVGASRSIGGVLNIIQPLGLAYLAAVLEKNNFCVKIIDCSLETSVAGVIERIIPEAPQIIGFSATTPGFAAALSFAKTLKAKLAGSIFIIGGPHITALPYQAMQDDVFDIGVIGEAEETFSELVSHIHEQGTIGLESIRGIIFRKGDAWEITARRELLKDLDSLPFPARQLLPALSRYKPTPASYRRLPLGVIMTSRGCPNSCTFCDRSVFGTVYRQRSAQNVLAEARELKYKYGAREIRFFDDCFTLDKQRTLEICKGMKKLKVPWTCLTTVTSVTKELLKEMNSSGCWQVLFGLESADERMLGLLRKNVTLKQNISAVRWAKQAGLSVRADFIVGTPGETSQSLQRTLKFAIDMKLDYAHFNKFVPFPGTELYRELVAQGKAFNFKQNCSILDHSALLYVPEGIPKDEYRRFLDSSFKKFYLRPQYIINRLLSIRTKDELLGQIKGFLAIALL
jgi:anaerobic magnesium-protoporphyrin IX monomethyl ester cyclase